MACQNLRHWMAPQLHDVAITVTATSGTAADTTPQTECVRLRSADPSVMKSFTVRQTTPPYVII